MHKSVFQIEARQKSNSVSLLYFLPLFVLILWGNFASAQIMPQEEPLSDAEKQEIVLNGKKERPEWFDKVHYGGNIWGGFFGAFYIDVAPMALATRLLMLEQ